MIESQSVDQTEFVEFVRAGEKAVGDFECVACGHSAVQRGALLPCPKCGSTLWERSAWTPFARVLTGLGDRLH
jgi:ribosomal protein L37AE/L43A